MADDQVKYSDLISEDVVKGLEVLNQALQDIKTTMAGVKAEAASLGVAIRNVSTATREQQQATSQNAANVERLSKRMKDLSEEERKVEEIKRRYKKLTDEQIRAVNAFQQALRGNTAQVLVAVNAIEVENKSYNELNAMYNMLKDSLNAMTVAERQNTEAGKAMTAQSAKIYDTMNELQKATGKYTLQVGKYRAAFDGLGYSFQQILREAPSALNLNQFFLAISNNIPMFLDQLKAFKNEQAEIKANLAQMTEGTKEYAEQMGKVESVGKKLGKVLISWQSLVLVGLMLLRNWDKIVNGIKGLLTNLTDEEKRLKNVSDAAASSIGEMTAKYEALRTEWQNLKSEDQGQWLEKHKNDWLELGYSIDDAQKAEDFYVNNTAAVQEAIDKRAKSIAGMKLAAEKYEEAFRKQVEAEQGRNARQTSFGSQLVRGLAGAGMAVGTAVLNPEQQSLQQRAEEQAIESLYQKRMEEAERLREEARGYLSFVDDKSISASGKQKDGKTPKDQVSDLLTLQRQLEDAIIANIEDEFEREEAAEIARHTRFVEDKEKELKLVKGDPERMAVIYKQIEEERNTHDNNMLSIDERYRQGIIKRIEDQKKREEQEEKEREQSEKEAQKNRVKALADSWQMERTQMVERGAKRKELIEAEIEAEENRLNVLLQYERGVNGEKMTPEEKAKIEEWIRLLNQLKAAGNFNLVTPGQIFGNGASNVGKKQKGNYTSVTDLLWPDLDNDQMSALNSVFDQAKAALNSWMDARKAAADQAKELADDEVSAAENALNREIELRNQGYANDVALKERELADAKARQKQAAEMQRKAEEDSLKVNTAMEASSMAVAVANLFKDFSLPVAIPLTAVLLGSFAVAKLKAIQAAKTKTYGEGGYEFLEGGSHQSGHDINLGIGPDGSNLRAEGGEYFAVINKRNSRKYGSEIPGIVNALNSGMFEDKYIKTSDAMGLMGRMGVVGNVGESVDLSAVESGVSEIVRQGERSWSVEGGYRVMRYKNLTRRVRI